MDSWSRLADLATAQSGLIAVWQARALGISRHEIAAEARRRKWKRLAHGVYLLPGHRVTRLVRVKAVELALQYTGLASHRTAMYLWGLQPRLDNLVEFIVAPSSSRTVAGATIRRHKSLAPFSEPGEGARTLGVLRHGILVARAPLAICTLAGVAGEAEAEKVLVAAHRKRVTGPHAVRRELEMQSPFPGCGRLQATLERVDQRLCHSNMEGVGRALLAGAGLTPHPWPYVVEDAAGQLIAELDIAFLREKVGVPIDGPHHFESDQRRADEDQRLALQAAGWELVRADHVRLHDQAAVFVRQVKEALARQRAKLQLPA